MSVLSDRDIRVGTRWPARSESSRTTPQDLQPSSVDLHLDRSLPCLPEQPLSVHRRARPAARPDRAAGRRGRRALHPASGRVRARPDARVGGAAERSRRQARRQGSLGRLGLLIHSTAGYVDPGWKGNLTLELSNVANLPIALYYGMRIGQISFFRMTSEVDRPYGSPELRIEVPGPVRADRLGVPPRLRRPQAGRLSATRPQRRSTGRGSRWRDARRARPGRHVSHRRRRDLRAGAADPVGQARHR